MSRFITIAFASTLLAAGAANAKNPVVVMETSLGSVEIELYEDKAPLSVKNFLSYVDDKYYDDTIFHRVINNFMIQGGGFTQDVKKKDTKAPVKNEAHNGLENKRGTVAMARTAVVDSGTSQFFVNVVDNTFLNHRGKGPREYGYAVFGRVIRGMDVVDKIKSVRTGSCGHFRTDCPQTPVVIKSIRRKSADAPAAKKDAAPAPAKPAPAKTK
jgi:peptidyl-prolyl cis-trans isomerase B (cyclophilin B)